MAVFPAHKAAADDDLFSIGGIDTWLAGATLDVGASSVAVKDANGSDVTASLYTSGSLAYTPDVVTIRLHGGTAGQTYEVWIDLTTQGASARQKRFRLALTVAD